MEEQQAAAVAAAAAVSSPGCSAASGGSSKTVQPHNPWALKCHQKTLSKLRRSASGVSHSQKDKESHGQSTQTSRLLIKLICISVISYNKDIEMHASVVRINVLLITCVETLLRFLQNSCF